MRLTVAQIAATLSIGDRDPSLTLRQVRHMAARGLLSDPRTADGRGTQSFPSSAVFEAEVFLNLADFGVVEGVALREVTRALQHAPDFVSFHREHVPHRWVGPHGGISFGPSLQEVITGAPLGERWVLTLTKRAANTPGLVSEWRATVLPIAAAQEEMGEIPSERDFLGPIRVMLTLDLTSLVSDVARLINEQG